MKWLIVFFVADGKLNSAAVFDPMLTLTKGDCKQPLLSTLKNIVKENSPPSKQVNLCVTVIFVGESRMITMVKSLCWLFCYK